MSDLAPEPEKNQPRIEIVPAAPKPIPEMPIVTENVGPDVADELRSNTMPSRDRIELESKPSLALAPSEGKRDESPVEEGAVSRWWGRLSTFGKAACCVFAVNTVVDLASGWYGFAALDAALTLYFAIPAVTRGATRA